MLRTDQVVRVVEIVAEVDAVIRGAPLVIVRVVVLVLDVAVEIGRRRRQLREAQVALEVERRLVPLVIKELVHEARDLVIAEHRVRIPPALAFADLPDQAGCGLPGGVDLPARSNTAAVRGPVIPVLLDRRGVVELTVERSAEDVVDVAALNRVKADGAHGDVVGHGNVDVPADVVAFLAALGRADLGIELRGIAGRVGLVRDVDQRAGLRARPEERPLRAGQRLDPLEVDRTDLDLLRVRGHRLVVEVYGDLAVGAELRRAGCDAAHHDRVCARLEADQADARQRIHDVLGALERLLLDVVGRERRDALRDRLQVELAPGCGDENFFESGVSALCQGG